MKFAIVPLLTDAWFLRSSPQQPFPYPQPCERQAVNNVCSLLKVLNLGKGVQKADWSSLGGSWAKKTPPKLQMKKYLEATGEKTIDVTL